MRSPQRLMNALSLARAAEPPGEFLTPAAGGLPAAVAPVGKPIARATSKRERMPLSGLCQLGSATKPCMQPCSAPVRAPGQDHAGMASPQGPSPPVRRIPSTSSSLRAAWWNVFLLSSPRSARHLLLTQGRCQSACLPCPTLNPSRCSGSHFLAMSALSLSAMISAVTP